MSKKRCTHLVEPAELLIMEGKGLGDFLNKARAKLLPAAGAALNLLSDYGPARFTNTPAFGNAVGLAKMANLVSSRMPVDDE